MAEPANYRKNTGKYKFNLNIKDGSGQFRKSVLNTIIQIKGGDTYAQTIIESLSVPVDKKWKAGYLTIEGTVLKNGNTIAFGTEQVLLKNRASLNKDLAGLRIEVLKWSAAEKALKDAGIATKSEGIQSSENNSVVIAGDIPDNKNMKRLLEKTSKGATLFIKFDEKWAKKLYELKILKTSVSEWGGNQVAYWHGNGWGYIDHFVGDQAIPSKSTIGTNSWEVPGNPKGFYPFEANYPQKAYGAWFARPDKLLVLIGEISYGEGKIILHPSYHIDEENAFNDLLFFNIIKEGHRK
ncbi:hypothetical protein [Polaribacter sp. SA4-12]|uniref:hypothetical protein n=1 Tax=Polaribacter sp. SA4-12 TaxID=1312072 RepID=UPI000B3CB2E9|nr:hypothetical protein [Polaribacter sp. SA4-12]ARV16586.1 hypothetical protein BTO07_16220 [Polaribacter sp. SA4-12]